MAVISRTQLVKELEPGLHALFGMEYKRWEREHAEIFTEETSDRAFEEETLITGFGAAPTKSEGASVEFDTASEQWTARYVHETIALAFAITEEAVEDNLYDTLSKKFKLGRVRILLKEPRSTLSWHRDPEPRLHIPIITNPGCLMVIDNVAKHLPADGSVWVTNNTKYHNAFNGGEENRIHLVACVLDYKFN